jgi:hypothetical protein
MIKKRPLIPTGPSGPIYGQDKTLPKYVEAAISDSIKSYSPIMDKFLADCEKRGWSLNSSWDLCVPGLKIDSNLFPVLVKHLQCNYPSVEKEGMIFALSHKEARSEALDLIQKIFDQEAMNPNPRLSDAAANTLLTMATKDDVPYFEHALLKDSYGDRRLFFVSTYTKFAKRAAIPLLRLLLDKGELLSEVINELGKLKDIHSRKRIEKFLHSENSNIQRLAGIALERLNKVHRASKTANDRG